mmetsp:Transcript_14643/g.42873  ORF Transcript_14643/g.42873 Transcript_14643/m.42873 type:complete len:239 (-) Transcript_14643:183-899(-)
MHAVPRAADHAEAQAPPHKVKAGAPKHAVAGQSPVKPQARVKVGVSGRRRHLQGHDHEQPLQHRAADPPLEQPRGVQQRRPLRLQCHDDYGDAHAVHAQQLDACGIAVCKRTSVRCQRHSVRHHTQQRADCGDYIYCSAEDEEAVGLRLLRPPGARQQGSLPAGCSRATAAGQHGRLGRRGRRSVLRKRCCAFEAQHGSLWRQIFPASRYTDRSAAAPGRRSASQQGRESLTASRGRP